MIRLLVSIGMVLFIYCLYEDMGESDLNRKQLRVESLKDKPIEGKEPDHWDWKTGKWIYKNEVQISNSPPNLEPSFDSSMVEQRGDYEVFIDPDLRPYVQLFFEYNRRFGDPIMIDYKNVYIYFNSNIINSDHAVGQCLNTDDRFEVRIDPGDWQRYPKHREALVLHELGHCILGRSHLDDMVSKNHKSIPRSIMHSKWYTYRGLFTQYYREYYLKELFNNF